MERKDLIKMASEAGFGKLLTGDSLPTMWHGADLGMLERFASLVAAAEREACAKVCDDYWDAIPGLGEGDYANGRGAAALDCAQAIRARSNAGIKAAGR